MQISTNTVVSLRYVMKNNDDEVLENIMDNASVKYLHGSGNILPALETMLEGLQPGNKKLISISNETGSEINNDFHFEVVIDDVRQATEEEIQKGKPIEIGEKDRCGPNWCC